MNRRLMVLLAGTVAGCSSMDGVWVLEVSPGDWSNVTETVEHNFTDASVRQEDTNWTLTEESGGSPGVAFAQILKGYGEDDQILVVGDRVYFGNKDGGIWDFVWVSEEDATGSATHTSGYSYTESGDGTFTETLSLDLSGGDGTGTFTLDAQYTQAFTETDIWSETETGFTRGNLPSREYLEYSEGGQVDNDFDDSDCADATCTLTLTNTATYSASVVLFSTDLDSEDFEGVNGAQNTEGLQE